MVEFEGRKKLSEKSGVVEIVGGALDIFMDERVELKKEVFAFVDKSEQRSDGVDGRGRLEHRSI